jgi:hypothetical protein
VGATVGSRTGGAKGALVTGDAVKGRRGALVGPGSDLMGALEGLVMAAMGDRMGANVGVGTATGANVGGGKPATMVKAIRNGAPPLGVAVTV